MKRKFSKLSMMVLGLVAMLILLPSSVFAQNGPLDLVEDPPLVGNYCVTTAGIGLEDPDNNPTEFTVNIPGEPVASYWYWTERARVAPYDGDPDFELSYNGGANVTVTAGESFASLENGGIWQWHSYFYEDAALDYIATGQNTFDVSGIVGPGNFEAHGIAVTVIYEDALNCPYGEVRVRKGLDSFRGNYNPGDGEEFGPDSELLCETFPASTTDREVDFSLVAGGVGDENKLNNLWYITGTGDPPTASIVDDPDATEILDPLGSLLGPEWDIYDTTITVAAGETYVCLQVESPLDTTGGTNTMSALWSGSAMVIPLEPPVVLGSIGDTITCADTGAGLEGVTVTLTGLAGGPITTTTAADGTYLFIDLPMGDYTVTVDASTIAGTCNIPAGDPDGVLDNMSAVTLTEAEPNDLAQDFSYTEPAPILGSIGDTITCVDTGAGLEGVTVTLTGLATGPITTTTAADGTYLFVDLPMGDYTVTVDASTIAGTCNIPAGDPDGVLDNMSTTTLTEAEPNDLAQDFSYTEPAPIVLGSIGDTLTCVDTGAGLGDVTVTLTGLAGGPISTTTAADGTYLFDELPLGDYTVTVDATTIAGTCNIPAGDPDGVLDNMSATTLTEAEPNDLAQDFSYTEPVPVVLGSIGDTLTCVDTGAGLEGVTVTLTGLADGPISTTTAADGTYLFDELPLGDYTVTVDATTIAGTCNIPAGDPDGVLDNMSAVTLTETVPNDLAQDFTYSEPVPQPSSIGDTLICADTGVGIEGVTVTLTNVATNAETPTQTDANGTYLFPGLAAGDYIVTVDSSTLPDTCNVISVDPDGGDDNMSAVSVGEGEDNLDQDFAYVAPPPPSVGSIGDTITCADTGAGIEGVTVTLTDVAANTETPMQTDANGMYLFPELAAGDYIVTVDTSTLPDTCNMLSTDPDGGDDNMSAVSLGEGVDNLDQDFVYSAPSVPVGSIGDTITCAATGAGIEGVTVTLTDSAGSASSTETNADGVYLFSDLIAGDYAVSVNTTTLPESCNVLTVDPDGDDDSSSTVTLGDGENNLAQDFEYDAPAPVLGSIGDRVWCDNNENGTFDAGEGIITASVILENSQNITATALTNDQGVYLFENLAAGSYTVSVDTGSLPNVCNNPSVDPDGGLDNQSTVELSASENNLSQDFAYVAPPPVVTAVASVGNFVWLDQNANGIQDTAEAQGVAGITVKLHDAATDTVLLQTITNSSGFYLFGDLQPGDYYISYELPDAYQISPQNTTTPELDSDANPASGRTNAFTLAAGDANLSLDQGVFTPTALEMIAEPIIMSDFLYLPLMQN